MHQGQPSTASHCRVEFTRRRNCELVLNTLKKDGALGTYLILESVAVVSSGQ